MKFLFYTPNVYSAGVAHRVMLEGNQVWMYSQEKKYQASLKGIVPHVSSLIEGLSKKPDVIVFDMSKYGMEAIKLKRQGYKVFGSGAEWKGKSFQDELELDREFGMNIMKQAGIKTPETLPFKGYQIKQAIESVNKNNKLLVVKLDDNKGGAETSYVGSSPDDMIAQLEYFQKEKLIESGTKFILQEKLEGVELSTEQWFYNGNPVFPANGTMETKKLMDNDLGPNTGCSSSTCWFYEVDQPKIIKETLAKVYPLMKQTKFTGPLDINCIISKKDGLPYGIEWTPRLGFSAIYALIRLLNMDISEALYECANGNMERFVYKPGFGYSIRVSIPPYPLAIPNEKLKEDIYTESQGERFKYEGSEELVFYSDLMKGEDGLVTAGIDGEVCEVTGYGKNLKQAVNEAEEAFKEVSIPNKQARLDGYKRVEKQIPILKGLGYEVPSIS